MVDKCEYGYIRNQKKINMIWLFVFVLIGVAIFVCGYLLTKTRANIFTVIAVLMVLPAAKRVVALVVMVPRKGVDRERYEKVSQAVGGGILFTDYVFTSSEKIMHLDFLLIKNGNVLGVTASSRQDVDYMKKYLTDSVHKAASEFHTKVFDSDEEMFRHLNRLTQVEADEGRTEKVREYLHSLAV
jgi:hypothetical protein